MRNLDEYATQCMKELDAIGIEYRNIVEIKANTRSKIRERKITMENIKKIIRRFFKKPIASETHTRYYPNMDEDFFRQIRETIAEINSGICK